MGRLSGHPAPRQGAATAGTQRLGTAQPPSPPPAAHRGGFFVPVRQKSVGLLQRNRLPAVFPQNRGNVRANKV